MDDFFKYYAKLIKFLMYAIVVLILLTILFLFSKTSLIWMNLLSDLWHCLIPFLIAFILAYLIHPLISKIDSFKLPRILSVLLFYVLVFGGLYVIISWFLPTIISQIRDLVINFPIYIVAIQEQLLILDIKFDLNLYETFSVQYDQIMVNISENVQNIVTFVFNFLSSIIGSFVSIIIIPIALFYFLKDYERITQGCIKLVPKRYRHHAVSLGSLLDDSLGSYLRGLFLIMISLSLIGTVLFMFAGMKYSLLFGVLIGFTDFIPFIGPIIGAIPVVFFALSMSWKKVITVVIIILILQFIEANILQPFIIGRNLDLHPIFVMILMLVAGTLFGFQGILLAFPVFIIFKTVIAYLMKLKNPQ
ncbi:MAG: AI-2E family transporter [Turicibacter sp.]